MFEHKKGAQFRTRRILLFAVITTSIISLAAAGSQVAAFSFMDSVKEFLGAAPAQVRVLRSNSEFEATAPAPPPVVCTTAPSGMISWWAAENNPGDNLNRNNAVLMGNAGFTAGMVGNAFNLDGNGDYAQVAAPTGLPVGIAARTVEVWFRTPQVSGSQPIFQYGTASDTQMFGLITGSSGHLHFYGHNNDLDGSTVLQPNTWYHGAVTYDGTNLKLYLNGMIEGQGSYPLVNTVLNSNGITIGARPGSDTWLGQIDEPTIYDRALSDSEILAIYNAGSAGKCSVCTPPPSGMVAWYGGDGNANDLQGNYPGVLLGGTLFTAGKVRQAFSFDGSDDYVDAGNINLANRSFSFDAWVKRNSSSSADLILGQGTANIGQGLHVGWRAGSNDFTFDFFNSTLNVADTPDTNWHHWAGSYNVTNGAKKIYKDGQLVGSNTGGGYSGGGSLWIGRSPWVNGDWVNGAPLDGLMDEVEIFDRVVSQAEFQAIYNAASAGKCASCAPTPSGMVAWWPGNNNANDIIGTNSGTLVGAGYGPGKVDQAFSLNGSTGYVQLTDAESLRPTTAITLDAWVKLSAAPAGHVLIFDHESPNPWYGYGLALTPERKVSADINTGSSVNLVGSTPLQVDQWTHVAMTYDGAFMRVYLNGSQDGSLATSGPINYTQTLDPAIGRRATGGGNYFPGAIDEVEVFNRALNAGEVQTIYSAGSAGKCRSCTPAPANMTQWWPGDGNANDIQGPTYENGTLINGVTYTPGMVGQAFSLDGVNDWVEAPAGVADFGSDPFTVDFWMKSNTNGTHDSPNFILGKSHANGGIGWDIRQGNNTIRVVGVNGWGFNITSDASAVPNQWHHIALTSSGTSVDLYIDGILKGTSPRSTISSTANPFRMGYTTDFGSPAFNGLLDEVEIFDRSLTANEIQAIFNAGSAGKCRTCMPSPSGMVDWWQANGNGDDIQGGPTATLANGAAYSPGKVGQAFTLDGVDDHATVPASSNWAFGTGDFTVELWMFNSANDNYRPIINNRRTPASENMWALEIYPVANRVEFHSGLTIFLTASDLLTSSSWNHVAVTRNGTTLTLYINGVPSGSVSNSSNFSEINDLQIGRDVMGGNNLGGRTFPGEIDELSIYNRALSGSEITAIFNAGGMGKCLPVGTPTPTATPTPTPNFDFELDPDGTVHPNITSWTKDFYAHNDCGLRGNSPYGEHALNVTTQRAFSGTKSIYSYSRNAGGGGGCNADPNSRHTTVDLISTVPFVTTGNNLYIWRSTIGYTTSSRWNFNISVILSDGVVTQSQLLTCRAWGLSEGCPGNFQDNADMTAQGSDGEEWYRHQIAIPPGMNHNNITVTIRHDQDSWDGTTAGSWFYYDLVTDVDPTPTPTATPTDSPTATPTATPTPEPTCAPPPAGMIAWWPGDGNANDIQGPTFENGTLINGAAYAAGMVGQAFSFDGIDDSVVVPSTTILEPNALTLDAWIFVDAAAPPSGNYGIIGKYYSVGGLRGYEIFIDNGKLVLRANSTNQTYAISTNDVIFGQWNHVAATIDSSSSYLYINGNLEGSGAGVPTIEATNQPFVIGARGGDISPGAYFIGRIDEAEVFSRALSGAEVSAIFNAGSAGKCRTCTQPPPDMVTWWPGEGNANDIQGSNNGTLRNGATYASGKIGQAFSLDGSNDFVEVPNSPGLQPTSALSVDAWIKLSVDQTTRSQGAAIVAKGYDAETPIDWAFTVTGSLDPTPGVLRPHVKVNGAWRFFNCNTVLQPNTWYHVAMTYDGNNLRCYLNGAPDGSLAATGAIQVTNGTLRIGTYSPSAPFSKHHFPGSIDELEIFNRSLTIDEIQRIYNAGSAGKCHTCTPPPPQMVAWWPGDNNANDIIGTNNGTLVGGPGFAPGMVGAAFSFNGSSQYVEIPDSPTLRPANGLTLDGWFNFNTSSPQSALISKPYNSGSSNAYVVWIQGGNLYGAFGGGAIVSYPFNPTPGQWYHIAYTSDQATSENRLMVDGIVVAYSIASASIFYDSAPLLIGIDKDNGSPVLALDGKADEAEVFSRALSPAEILAIYNAGSAGKCKTGCVQQPANMAGWWPGNDSTVDIIGGNNGTLVNGAGYGSGDVGNAFSLNGQNQYILVGDPVPAALQIQNEITLSAWIYATNYPMTPDLIGTIMGSQYDTQAGGVTIHLDGRTNSDGQVNPPGHIHFQIGDGSGWHATNTMSSVPLNQWVHIVATRRAGEDGKVYYNGVLQPSMSAPWPSGAISYSGAWFAIGKQKDVYRPFKGLIDEAQIFSRALTATEIQSIYNAGSAGVCPPTTVQTSTTVSSSANPSVYSDSVTFTAAVSPIPMGGTIQFNIDGADVGVPVTINGSGQATFMTSSLTVNGGTPHTVTASYSGFGVHVASTGSLITGQTVNPAPSTTTINCASGTFVYTGSPITPCTATVTGADLNTTVPVTYAGNTNVGTATANALYPGGPNHSASVATEVTFQITPGPTVTTITGDNNDPSVYGETITVNFTVVAPGGGTPAGNVVITVSGGAETCTGTVAVGSCSIQINGIGARTLTATYAGGGNFLGSSDTEAHTVNKADTTTAITSDNPDPSIFGQNYTVLFTVVANSPGAGTPTGTVSVSDGTNNCSATVAAGQCVLPSISPGSKTLTATYPGDSFFNGSSDTEAHQVDKANTTTTVTASPGGPSVFGQSVTFTATVSVVSPGVGSPTGTVSFNIDGNLYCVNTPVNGSFEATCTQAGLPALPAGVRNVVAIYNGDANFNGSAGTNNYTVNKANTTTSIISDTPDPSLVGQAYAVQFAVEAAAVVPELAVRAPGFGTPTGTVTVSDGSGNTCTAPVGTGTCSLTSTTVGYKSLVAGYSGDANYNGSVSGSRSHDVILLMAGRVMQADTLEPLAGVSLTMTGYDEQNRGFVVTTTTDPSGNYKFEGFWYGDCTIAPTGLDKVYDPISRSYGSVVTNHTGIDFLAYDDGMMPRELSLPTAFVTPGEPAAVPVTLESLGNEASIAFTVGYDFNPFAAPPNVTCGADAPGCALITDTSVLGKIGITVVPTVALTPGPKRIVTLTFQSHPITTGPNSPLVFEIAEPTQLAVLNSSGDPLPVSLKNGMIVFALGIEGDVTGRNAGDGVVDSTDIVLVRRFIAGLETVAPEYNEFQRADTAPAYSKGDGSIDATDVIQARRYASALDPPQAAGGPGIPLPPPGTLAPRNPDRERTRMIGVGTIEAAAGSRITLPVEINAEGDETATSMTITYDHTKLSGPDVVLANGLPGAILTFGAREPGVVRLLVEACETFGSSSTKAIPLVLVSFDLLETAASGETPVEIEDLVVSDANARILTASSVSGMVSISGPNAAGVEVSGRVMTADGRGIRNAIVLLADQDRNIRATTTGSFGHYRFRGVPSDAWYLLRVQAKRFRFIPRRIHVTGPMTDVDLIALE